jgi:hypothetical protein
MPRLTKEQHRENLAVAYSIIGGIPEEYFHLNNFSSTNEPNAVKAAHCGTVGCTLGWLARHPYFMAQGLFLKGSYIAYRDPITNRLHEDVDMAAARLFGTKAFYRYFNIFGRGTKDLSLTDPNWNCMSRGDNKKLALARLKDGYYDPKYTKN